MIIKTERFPTPDRMSKLVQEGAFYYVFMKLGKHMASIGE